MPICLQLFQCFSKNVFKPQYWKAFWRWIKKLYKFTIFNYFMNSVFLKTAWFVQLLYKFKLRPLAMRIFFMFMNTKSARVFLSYNIIIENVLTIWFGRLRIFIFIFLYAKYSWFASCSLRNTRREHNMEVAQTSAF